VGIVVRDDGHWPADVERILARLPQWFGIEESNRSYVAAAAHLPSWAAVDERGDVVGVCLVRRHTDVAAEIELLAVLPELHRQGVGRQLVDAVGEKMRTQGVRLLQVKTFGPSGDSPEYERTRAFYFALGFLPLEERTDIWDEDNPCLISVLPL
jgi:N-acetylglutamate synthase-like GNAT family acetyltransferase